MCQWKFFVFIYRANMSASSVFRAAEIPLVASGPRSLGVSLPALCRTGRWVSTVNCLVPRGTTSTCRLLELRKIRDLQSSRASNAIISRKETDRLVRTGRLLYKKDKIVSRTLSCLVATGFGDGTVTCSSARICGERGAGLKTNSAYHNRLAEAF